MDSSYHVCVVQYCLCCWVVLSWAFRSGTAFSVLVLFLFPSAFLLENIEDVMKCIPCFVTTQGSHSCSCSVPVVCYSLWIEFESTFYVLCDVKFGQRCCWGFGAAVSGAESWVNVSRRLKRAECFHLQQWRNPTLVHSNRQKSTSTPHLKDLNPTSVSFPVHLNSYCQCCSILTV